MDKKPTLTIIQNSLKVPKNQYNAFGKYNYRSCEDILAAVKPLLLEHDITMSISDYIVEIGGHNYVKAEVILTGGGEKVVVYGWAREPEERRGMDSSQITGAASSYARKYALNGLFLLDDIKDADAQPSNGEVKDNKPEKEAKPTKEAQHYPTADQAKALKEVMTGEQMGLSDTEFESFKEYLKGQLPTMPVKSKEGNVKALSKESYKKVLMDPGFFLDQFIKAQKEK